MCVQLCMESLRDKHNDNAFVPLCLTEVGSGFPVLVHESMNSLPPSLSPTTTIWCTGTVTGS